MSEYLLTYFWTGLECVSLILLYDAFSERKGGLLYRYAVIACFVILTATILNLVTLVGSSFIKIPLAIITYFILHKLLYHSGNIFRLYIVIIYYSTLCCIDNFCFVFWICLYNRFCSPIWETEFIPMLAIHFIIIITSFIQKHLRKNKPIGDTKWTWFTVPAILSFTNLFMIFFFGDCYQESQISTLPLLVCASFITVIQVATLFLVSWMEKDAHYREETISLQIKAMAQQESIEALSAAYDHQRKITHDFRAYLDILDSMLARNNINTKATQDYIYSLKIEHTKGLLLVSTHHATLDALLNQKALVARKRKIDIQFKVNDLSATNINMVDITILISNTIDNAIEACEKLPVNDRQIYVQVLLEEDVFFYAVRNRSLPVNMESNRPPRTTKDDSFVHGFGLQNVLTTLKKYNSVYAINYSDGWFEFATDLPNTLIS